MNKRQCWLRLTVAVLLYFGLTGLAQAATTYYVRTDGGTDTQCTGKADAAYPGTGSNLACAFSHPFYVLSAAGSPNRMVGGDTLILGPGQYMMGFGAPNSPSCSQFYPWDCSMRAVPSGTAANPTRILGKGYDTGCASKPQLWGTERSASVLDLRSSSNVEVQCLEITDHSSCMDSGPDLATKCNRDSYPYGPWAMIGIVSADSQNVLLKNVYIHGLRSGILAGRLTNWTLENTDIIANSFVGWDGDIGADVSSNSGTITFKNSKIQWSGCGETYPGLQLHHCYSQDQGGYGDGLGTHRTGANWVFDNVDFSHNVSDGLDLLYHNGTGSITITHSRFQGNAGNQVKVAASTNIDNSKMIGNCAYFNGKSFTSTTGVGFNSVAFNNCRAGGNTIAVEFRPGMQFNVYTSTITGNGDVLVQSSGSGCLSADKIVSKNNIYIGGPEFNNGGQDLADLYYAAGATGNGDGACGAVPFSTSSDIIWGTKNNSVKCTGTSSKCVDPKVVGPINYNGEAQDVSLQQTSPAIKAGVVMSNVPNSDFNYYSRGTSWDVGALQFGSVPSQNTTPPPVSTPVCGNGVLETGEQCDGTSLNGQSCTTQGFVGGVLGCSSACMFSTSSCTMSLCGNGSVESSEQCDGTNFAGQTCLNNGFAGGSISCSSSCTLNTSGCLTSLCGNGVVDSGEQCDGSSLNGKTCATQGFSGGTLSCSSCMLNTSSCSNTACGNGVVEAGEQCDGTNFNGQTCASSGFSGGTLSCSNACAINTTSCTSVDKCGNGIKEGIEICDDGNLVNNDGCTSVCKSEYCGDGVKQANEQCDDHNWINRDGCSALCKLEASVCGNGIKEGTEQCDDTNISNNDGCSSVCKAEYCGDGIRQSNEQCDGSSLNGQTCSTKGFVSGTLSCSSSCTFNTASCSIVKKRFRRYR